MMEELMPVDSLQLQEAERARTDRTSPLQRHPFKAGAELRGEQAERKPVRRLAANGTCLMQVPNAVEQRFRPPPTRLE